MNIHLMQVGAINTNCYILENENGNAIIIDPGDYAESILSFLKKEKLDLKKILLTHGHFDHIGAITILHEKTGAEVYIHEADEELLLNPDLLGEGRLEYMEGYLPRKADKYLKDGDKINLDSIEITVMETPGHSKGSCVFICDGNIFSGDTLFCEGVGRTDLYGGDMRILKKSLEKLAALKGDFDVLPGHGNSTTLQYERKTNPYMGTNYDDIF